VIHDVLGRGRGGKKRKKRGKNFKVLPAFWRRKKRRRYEECREARNVHTCVNVLREFVISLWFFSCLISFA
jgi:hypothetical protein